MINKRKLYENERNLRIAKAFGIFIGKRMINDYWTNSKCICDRIVFVFRILIGKVMVNDHWIICVFGRVSGFGM